MIVLAEISDKIFLPVDALVLGGVVGALVLILGVVLSIHSRLWILFLCWCAFVVFFGAWSQMIDPTLAEVAEREIPWFHMRMRAAMGGPVLAGAFVAWLIGSRFHPKRFRGEGICGGCWYSLVGLDGGVFPECGEGLEE